MALSVYRRFRVAIISHSRLHSMALYMISICDLYIYIYICNIPTDQICCIVLGFLWTHSKTAEPACMAIVGRLVAAPPRRMRRVVWIKVLQASCGIPVPGVAG